MLLATQNPMDLDYRSLSNAGLWCVGRLQTDADRARVIESLAPGTERGDAKELARTVKGLAKRWFVVRDASLEDSTPFLAQPRHAMSWLRGPLTRTGLARLRQATV